VDGFCDDGGSHKIRVTGYECVASAVFTNSSPYSGLSPSDKSASEVERWASSI
jgi:hypothetical protein